MKSKHAKKIISVLLCVMLIIPCLTGCTLGKKEKQKETITVYLWSYLLNETYAPYIQSQLPDIDIQFVVGQNDLDFYKFLEENQQLPDVIMSRRFSRHDALPLKDHLLNLANTEEAGAVYDTYLTNFSNSDGTINWLPVCGTVDGIVANKGLFEKYNIPLPTDYDSFISACKSFEKHGIRGYVSDFVYDYTCMEVLQGLSIPELTSLKGQMWRNSYEDPEDETCGLDDEIWPVIFERMEQFLKEAKITESDLMLYCDPIETMFREEKLAMFRAVGETVVSLNEAGIETLSLPYYGANGEQWLLTYPEFQIALSGDLEQDESRKQSAMKVLNVMLSQGAQSVLSNCEDVISYHKNVKLELSPYLNNLEPLIAQNKLFIRIASNDFFAVSKDVVTKMIQGQYDAKQAYEAFDQQLREAAVAKETEESIYTQKKGYKNVFYPQGGNKNYSSVANTLQNVYQSDVVVAAGFSFTGSVVAAEYTQQQIQNLIMPNSLLAFHSTMNGAQLTQLIKDYVEGVEGGFKPFNRGSLPIVSGVTINVLENNNSYELLDVQKDGKKLNDKDTFRVTFLSTGAYADALQTKDKGEIKQSEELVQMDLLTYIQEGGSIAKPSDYITIKIAK